MKRKSKDWEIESSSHEELMEGLDGVRITRRITLRGTVAAAVLLALGVPACGGEQNSEQEEDEDEADGSKGAESKNSSSKKSKQGDGSETSKTPEDSQDPEQDSKEPSKQEPEPEEPEPEEPEPEEPEPEEPQEPISLQEFFDAIMEDAQAITKDSAADEAAYLQKVDKFLRRVETEVPKISPGSSYNMKNIKKQGPVSVYVMEIRANTTIPLHNHVNHTGNVLGWRGEVKTRNFTKIDGEASNGGFLLQETDSRTLTKGKTGYLARVQNNFHLLETGPEGATLLDVFTYFPRSGASRFATLSDEPVDKEKKIYEARWSRGVADMDPRRDFS